MNLLAFINNDYIKFFREDNNVVSLISTNYLYFYYDKASKKFKNNIKYKIFASEEKDYFYGNILVKTAKNENLVFDGESFPVSNLFFNVFETSTKSSNFEKIIISYSDSIDNETKSKLNEIISSKYNNADIVDDFSVLASKNYIKNNQILSPINELFVCSENETNISITKLNFSGSAITTSDSVSIKYFAYEPYAYEIAKKICEDIYRLYSPKTSFNIEENIDYVYSRIKDKAEEIVNQPKSIVVVSTRLKNSQERYVVQIKPDDIKVTTKIFLKNLTDKIQKKANISASSRVIFFGDLFKNELINEKLDDTFSNYYVADIANTFSTRDAEFSQQVDEYSTMFLAEDQMNLADDSSKSEKVESLSIDSIQIGTQIKLTTFDAKPGKGQAIQTLEFIGDAKFVVIDSTRSLKTGDVVKAEAKMWTAGIKLIFEVTRAGKVYGRFQTRDIQTIEILK